MVNFTLHKFNLNFLKWKKSLLWGHSQKNLKVTETWRSCWVRCIRPPGTVTSQSVLILRGRSQALSFFSFDTCPASPCTRKGNWTLRKRLLPILDFLKSRERLWTPSILRSTWKERQQLDLEKWVWDLQ